MNTEAFPSGLDDFLAALRFEGVPISPHQFIWLQHAFRLEPHLDRESLKDLLACTLIKHESHRETFESLFEAWCRPDDVQTQNESPADEDTPHPGPSPVEPSTPDFEPTEPEEKRDQPKTATTTTQAWTSWRTWVGILVLIGLAGLGYQFIPQGNEQTTKNGSGTNGDPGTPSPDPVQPKPASPLPQHQNFGPGFRPLQTLRLGQHYSWQCSPC